MATTDTKNNKTQNQSNTGNTNTNISTDMQTAEKTNGKSLFLRIFAIIGLIVIVGLYILSLVASLSDWENSFGIFAGALGATIFVPIVIYLIRLFSKKD